MDFKLRNFLIFLTISFVVLSNENSWAACGEKEQQTKIYKTFKECLDRNTLKIPAPTLEQDRCQNCELNQKISGLHQKLCEDPMKVVCKKKTSSSTEIENPILTSECKGLIWSTEVELTPGFVDLKCSAEEKARRNLGAEESRNKTALQLETQKELQLAAYSDENEKKLKRIIEQVKTAFIKLIKDSDKVPDEHKEFLIDKIRDIEIYRFSNLRESKVPGTNVTPNGPTVEAYLHGNEIFFSLGFLAQLEHIDQYAMIRIIAHEVSHSIDPCEIEHNFATKQAPNEPLISQKIYGSLIKCLRGGRGNDGCEGAILPCSDMSRAEIMIKKRLEDPAYRNHMGYSKNFTQEEKNKWFNEWFGREREKIKMKPSCGLQQFDLTEEPRGADYHRGYQKDQIREAFADAISAQVTGAILQEDREKLTDENKTNVLLAISYEMSQLHGRCFEENTSDSHPAGYLRMGRILLGNRKFRDAVGCLKGPPKMNGAGTECLGL